MATNRLNPITDMEMSWVLSRSVMYPDVLRRMLISTIWPSTQDAGQRSTASWYFWLTTLTGHGFSAVVSRARRGSWSSGFGAAVSRLSMALPAAYPWV